MDSMDELLKKKANKFDIDRKLSELELAQAELDRFANGDAKVSKFADSGEIFIHTPSSTLASELRINQIRIIDAIEKSAKKKIEKFIVLIR